MADKGLKLAVSGKGGVGKTTLAATLARVYAESEARVETEQYASKGLEAPSVSRVIRVERASTPALLGPGIP